MPDAETAAESPNEETARHVRSFQEETLYCNFNAPSIRRVAEELRAKHRSDTDFAIAAFGFVQDEIWYSIMPQWSFTAEETLHMRQGCCTNKANLLVALLRAGGMSAAFHVMRVDGRSYLGPAVPKWLSRHFGPQTNHVCAAVLLNGQWIRVDPSDDQGLSLGGGHLNPPCLRVTFDGTCHADMNLDKAHVLSVSKRLADVDSLMCLESSLKKRAHIQALGHLVRFLRQHGASFSSIAMYHHAILGWLLGRDPHVCQLVLRTMIDQPALIANFVNSVTECQQWYAVGAEDRLVHRILTAWRACQPAAPKGRACSKL